MTDEAKKDTTAAAKDPAPHATAGGIFSDDDSSSDDGEAKAEAGGKASTPAQEDSGAGSNKPSNSALFGDDDSDDDGSGGDEKDGKGDKSDDDGKSESKSGPASEPAAAKGGGGGAPPGGGGTGLFGSDSSDGEEEAEDAEFDDDTAGVKGRSATEAERAAMAERSAEAKAKAGAPYDDDAVALAVAERQIRPRRLEVLDIARPPEIHRSSKLSLHVTKLPNLVGIQPRPYDAETHDAAKEEEDYRGYTHSMIRWRYRPTKDAEQEGYARDKAGKLIRESNARFVRWSDGTCTIHIGDEMFDVDQIGPPKQQQAAKANEARLPGINGYVYLTQTVQAAHVGGSSAVNGEDGVDDDGGAAAAGGGEPLPELVGQTLLECQGPVVSKLVVRPSSLSSAAHRNLTLAVRNRNMKKARIAEVVTTEDPELEKQRRTKMKDDIEKQRLRSNRGYSSGRKAYGSRPSMSKNYLEGDDDDEHYDSVNVGKGMKRRVMGGDGADDYGTDSGEEDDEWSRRKMMRGRGGTRSAAGGARRDDPSSDEAELDFGDDDDDDDDVMVAKAGKNRKRAAVVDDDEE